MKFKGQVNLQVLLKRSGTHLFIQSFSAVRAEVSSPPGLQAYNV